MRNALRGDHSAATAHHTILNSKKPCAVRQDCWLIHNYAVGDPSWRGKYRFFRIRVITDRRPYTEPSVNICVALRVEKPQLTGRSEPQTWVKCPAFRRRGFYDQLRFAESRPRIISREQSDGISAFLVVHPTAKAARYRPDAVFSTVGMP